MIEPNKKFIYQKYGSLFNSLDMKFNFGDGWFQTLVHALTNISKTANLRFKISEIEAKDGKLNIVCSNPNNEVCHALTMAEMVSATTCDVCGVSGASCKERVGHPGCLCDVHCKSML